MMQNLKAAVSDRYKRVLKRWRRTVFERCGSARYSRPALNGLDRKLERYLHIDNGFFVEAGANDGFQQSNTYYFEKLRGWTGVLVEPVPELAAECRRNRRGPVVEAALVAEDSPGATVPIRFAGLMSVLAHPTDSMVDPEQHVRTGLESQHLSTSYTVDVPARTLSSILDELGVTREIDLLSLDVEGAEIGVLRGIDWARHAPRFICIEVRQAEPLDALLFPRYERYEVLSEYDSYRDVLYKRRLA